MNSKPNDPTSRRRFLGRVGGISAAVGLAQIGVSTALTRPVLAAAGVQLTVDASDIRGRIINPAHYMNQSLTAFREEGPLPASAVEDLKRNFNVQVTRVFINPHLPPADFNAYLEQASSYSRRLMVCYTSLPADANGQKPRDKADLWEQLLRTVLPDHKPRFPKIEYIEPWNEPNVSAGGNFTPAEYYEYYKATYRAVNAVNAQLNPSVKLRVGGPAVAGFPSSFIAGFLDLYQADSDNSKKLDFVSFHEYGAINAPRRIRTRKSTIHAWLNQRGLPLVPVVPSESGPYPGSNGTTNFKYDRLVQAAAMAAMGREYMLGDVDMPMHWVLNHPSNDRKDMYVDGTDRTSTPYGNVVRLQQLQKTYHVATGIVPAPDSNGIGVGGISTSDNTGMAIMYYNYQAQNGTTGYDTTVTVNNLPASFTNHSITLRHYLIDTSHNNHDYDATVDRLTARDQKVLSPASSVTYTTTLEKNATALLVLEPVEDVSQR